MSHFQVTATLAGGALVLLGVQAEDEDAALCLARVRLSWSGQEADHLTVTPVCGDSISRLAAARVTARPPSAEPGR